MTDAPDIKAKPQRRATSLADLKSGTIDAVLDYGDYELLVPIRMLTLFEWNRIGFSVAVPAPPTVGGDKRGPIFDRNDPTYLRQLAEAEQERGYLRLLAAIELPIEGETQAERLDALKAALGVNAAVQLMQLMNAEATKGNARIVARAETFHRNGTGDPARVPGDEVVAEPVLPVA